MVRTTLRRVLVLAALALATVSAAADDPQRVGNETCAGCHDDLAAAFARTVHGKADPEGSCEGCHGPGEAHANEADPQLIFRFGPEVPPGERTAACLACHRRDPQGRTWPSSDHDRSSVACDDCHDPHAAGLRPKLLAEPTVDLCYRCHDTTRAQFQLTERHPVGPESMSCTDCHDPHAASSRSLLGGFKQAACLRCHTEYRGPWVFEHESLAVEGCTICHTPHGSVNRHLLTYQRVGDLCLQCHPEQPFFHVVVDASGQRTTGYNDCTRCHTEIHGSNNDALFLN